MNAGGSPCQEHPHGDCLCTDPVKLVEVGGMRVPFTKEVMERYQETGPDKYHDDRVMGKALAIVAGAPVTPQDIRLALESSPLYSGKPKDGPDPREMPMVDYPDRIERRRPDVAIIGHVDQGRVLFPPGSSAVTPAVLREALRLRQFNGIVLDLVTGVWVMSTEGNPRPQEVVDIWVAGGRIPNVTHIGNGDYMMGCGPTHADAWLRPIRPDGLPLRER